MRFRAGPLVTRTRIRGATRTDARRGRGEARSRDVLRDDLYLSPSCSPFLSLSLSSYLSATRSARKIAERL